MNAAARPSSDRQRGTREGAPGRRYRARVQYDGTEFAGFQVQPGARTVQGALEAALSRLTGGVRTPVDAAGRTDAGVHAEDQLIAFTYGGALDGPALGRALNALLPADVAVRDVRSATATFHPRYAARYREYRYSIWNGPRSPLRERFALGVRTPLDVEAMAAAAGVLVGRHDFAAFAATSAAADPTRTVHSVVVRRSGRLVTVDVRADAFLRGMVRRIVAVLLEVGRGKLKTECVAAMLAAREPALAGASAPAHGLCLRRVALGRTSRRRVEEHVGASEER